MSESCQASGWVSDSHIILKIAKRRARNVVSPACNILLVMPDGPGDLSSFNFLSISVSSSSSVIGAVEMEGVVGVPRPKGKGRIILLPLTFRQFLSKRKGLLWY